MPKARVLAVDDQRYFRELIEGLLTDEGYEVVTASSGEEALHLLEREDFDIVLTDLVMPGIDGTQLVERVKKRLPDQEIVMVTGESRPLHSQLDKIVEMVRRTNGLTLVDYSREWV